MRKTQAISAGTWAHNLSADRGKTTEKKRGKQTSANELLSSETEQMRTRAKPGGEGDTKSGGGSSVVVQEGLQD